MAVTRASKLISLTNSATGEPFYLSTNKILYFKTVQTTKSYILYVNQRGKTKDIVVDESVATIHTATLSNTLYASQAITLANGDDWYIMSDRIIYMDVLSNSSPLIGKITYDMHPINPPKTFEFSAPSLATLNTANGNTFAITTQPQNGQVSRTRYINNLFIDAVISEPVGDLPTLAATYKIKVETVSPSAGGSGYTAATVSFSGGGTGAVLPTATATVGGGGDITGIVIATAGSNITADVLCTISGDGTGALAVNVIHHILDTLTVSDGGSNLNTAPTVTFSAGTVTAVATMTLDANTQTVTGTTISNAGSYLASAFPPTLTIAGGAGAKIFYDEKKTEFKKIEVEATAATIASTVNAL